MFKTIKNMTVQLFTKLNSMFKEKKIHSDWSSTTFISLFTTVVPILLWVILSATSGTLLVIPESVLTIIIAGITGKVFDKRNKIKGNTSSGE